VERQTRIGNIVEKPLPRGFKQGNGDVIANNIQLEIVPDVV
jgi:hypothetical protein